MKFLLLVPTIILALSGCGSSSSAQNSTSSEPVIEESSEDMLVSETTTEDPLQKFFPAEPIMPIETTTITTTTEATTEATTAAPPIMPAKYSNITICIDPGHGIFSKNYKENEAPGSSVMKNAFNSGTRGSGMTEEQFTLKVGLKLKAELEALGFNVIMTRQTSQCDLSNKARAEFANTHNANLVVRIHADGSENSSARGISMLIPKTQYLGNSDILSPSKRAGEIVLNEVIATTGASNRGIVYRGDLVGFNWSSVPAILIEAGFMTNPDEDRLLESDAYQNKIVTGIKNGVVKYFDN